MKQSSWAAHAGCARRRGAVTLGVRPAPGHGRPSGGDSAFQRAGSGSPGEETGPCSLPSGLEGRRNERGSQQLYPEVANHAVTGNSGHEGPGQGLGACGGELGCLSVM